jgi:hypothetical protein
MKTALIANGVPRALCIIATIHNECVMLHCYLYIVRENYESGIPYVQKVECNVKLIPGEHPFTPLMKVSMLSLSDMNLFPKDVEYSRDATIWHNIDAWYQV